jgi:soluble epoxide hydrolase / lipid-phosphate phosphatase
MMLGRQFDSCFSLVYPADPTIWKDHLAPSGAMEAWVTINRQATMAPHVTEETSSFGHLYL